MEETEHFLRVTPVGFRRIMLEAGEVLGLRRTLQYFREYVGVEAVTTWTDFMFIVASLKARNQARDAVSTCGTLLNYSVGLPCHCYSECLSSQLTLYRLFSMVGSESYHEQQKIGDWQLTWHPLAERWNYTNVKTQEAQWDTPEEVRFYLPTKMEEQLLEHFNEGELQDFRIRFAHLDMNSSGAIDEHEFRLLLESMGIKLSSRHRRKLVREIDINGNGIIEFHEFCFMMLTLHQSNNGLSSIWDKINLISDDAEKLHEVSQEMVQSTLEEQEFGADQEGKPFQVLHKHVDHFHGADEALLDPTSLPYARQVLLETRQKEKAAAQHAFENDSFEQLLGTNAMSKKKPAKKSGFQDFTCEIEAISKEGAAKEAFMEHNGVERINSLVRAGEAKEDRMYAKQLLARDVAAGKVVVEERTINQYQSMSRFAELFRPMNPDEAEEKKEKKKEEKERLPYTGESYVDRMTRKREERAATEEAARGPSYAKMGGSLLYATSIGALVTLGKCIINCRQTASDCVEGTDDCIAYVQCRRKGGIHGKHCMCGCRFTYPEDVTYPFWTDKKTEPLSWDLVFDCN